MKIKQETFEAHVDP